MLSVPPPCLWLSGPLAGPVPGEPPPPRLGPLVPRPLWHPRIPEQTKNANETNTKFSKSATLLGIVTRWKMAFILSGLEPTLQKTIQSSTLC